MSLGCDEIFDVPAEEAITAGMAGFDSSGMYKKNTHQADVASESLITTCKGGAFDALEAQRHEA